MGGYFSSTTNNANTSCTINLKKYDLSYKFSNVKITITKERIENLEVDVIVNSVGAGDSLSTGSISNAILAKAGPSLEREYIANKPRNVTNGELIITNGYNTNARFIYHVHGQSWDNEIGGQSWKCLDGLILKILSTAIEKRMSTIGIPAIGTGLLNMPPFVCVDIILTRIKAFLGIFINQSIKEIRLSAYSEEIYKIYYEKMISFYKID